MASNGQSKSNAPIDDGNSPVVFQQGNTFKNDEDLCENDHQQKVTSSIKIAVHNLCRRQQTNGNGK
jgi:hypothetical protein